MCSSSIGRWRGGWSTVWSDDVGEAGPLSGRTVRAVVDDVATHHARHVLCELGAQSSAGDADLLLGVEDGPRHPAEDWAASGGLWLTGRSEGPPLHPVGAPASAARGALLALAEVARLAGLDPRRLPSHELLGERAAIAGFSRQGPRSVGGAFELLPAADGWVGVNLARQSDLDLVPALTEGAVASGSSDEVQRGLAGWLASTTVAEVGVRARLLGMPLVVVPSNPRSMDDQLEARWGTGDVGVARLRRGGRRQTSGTPPTVVDLSALWAGPLVGHLLRLMGARVVKVEGQRRPDGARRGPTGFFDLLHAGKEAVALDLATSSGRSALQRLVRTADVVVDASRPRAMAQLGVDVEATVDAGTSWVSITGYGRTGPWSDQPAFGDDAAAAAGLLAWDSDGPVPAGDAIADPLAGLHAAVGAVAALSGDHAWLVDVAMRDVALVAARLPVPPGAPPRDSVRPRARQAGGVGPALGQDTDRVLAEFGIVA